MWTDFKVLYQLIKHQISLWGEYWRFYWNMALRVTVSFHVPASFTFMERTSFCCRCSGKLLTLLWYSVQVSLIYVRLPLSAHLARLEKYKTRFSYNISSTCLPLSPHHPLTSQSFSHLLPPLTPISLHPSPPHTCSCFPLTPTHLSFPPVITPPTPGSLHTFPASWPLMLRCHVCFTPPTHLSQPTISLHC